MKLKLREMDGDYKLTLSPDELDHIITALGYTASYAAYDIDLCGLIIELEAQLKIIKKVKE